MKHEALSSSPLDQIQYAKILKIQAHLPNQPCQFNTDSVDFTFGIIQLLGRFYPIGVYIFKIRALIIKKLDFSPP